MNEINIQVVSSMYHFSIAFFIAALVFAVMAVAASLSGNKKEAAPLIRDIFGSCMIYALILLGLAWLIS